MAESPNHEIQVGINVEQEQGEGGDVPDGTIVNSDNHCAMGDI